MATAFAKLDELSRGADFLLGHNLIAFDLPHLKAANPGLRLLRLPAVDTLRLNPLAFPRNPYHHLVKHYQDGQLKRGRINDPELDARLTLEVFNNQQKALRDAPLRPDDGMALADHCGLRRGFRQGIHVTYGAREGRPIMRRVMSIDRQLSWQLLPIARSAKS